jgi:MoxR-like ATPase
MGKTILTYRGKNSSKGQLNIEPYIPSEDLVDAVNLALALDCVRPLLLMGEPGCGKTSLAEAVAYEFHGEDINKHFFRWDIKSTTKSKDGIYQFDALRRLYDANIARKEDIDNMKEYITYGPLADAFTTPQNGDFPNILLIDEIDKADIDFPNDLLLELHNKEFVVLETKERVKASSNVLVFITSNNEKELPSPFLRRCLFHFIAFPNTTQLKEILNSKFHNNDAVLLENAIKIFENLREKVPSSQKPPSTSELVDWYAMLEKYSELKGKSNLSEHENRLIKQLDLMEKDEIPYLPVLLKTYESSKLFSK